MPLVSYLCPDRVEIPISDCLTSCRMKERCLPLPILRSLKPDRIFRPIASASQAGTGARKIILEAWEDFAQDPQDFTQALIGIATHAKLEGLADGEFLSEEPFAYPADKPFVTGKLDLYDHREATIWDHKVWGSYKINQLVKGEWEDNRDLVLQLNCYRILPEVIMGFPVKALKVCAIARDGGTWLADKRGGTKGMTPITVPFLPMETVLDFYQAKTRQLQHACETGVLPEYCSPFERWKNRRCEKYCPVSYVCGYLQRKGV